MQRLDVLSRIYSMSPPEGGVWNGASGAADTVTRVHMPDGLTLQVPVKAPQTVTDLLHAACKVWLWRKRHVSTAFEAELPQSKTDAVKQLRLSRVTRTTDNISAQSRLLF